MKARTPWICGNWKMYKTEAEVSAFFAEFLPLVDGVSGVDVGIAAPFTLLKDAVAAAKGGKVVVGAQNIHWADEGAFTGEVSAAMLLGAGCGFSIVGHSERRQYFGETDDAVGRRCAQAIKNKLVPILCVGETLAERERGDEFAVVERQLSGAFAHLAGVRGGEISVAYEPVWAIGTGKTATSAQAQEMHNFIRKTMGKICGDEFSQELRILYGGSVKPDNVAEIMAGEDVDGALVGGASLVAKTFASLVRFRV